MRICGHRGVMGVKTDLKPWRCGSIVFSWFDGDDGS